MEQQEMNEWENFMEEEKLDETARGYVRTALDHLDEDEGYEAYYQLERYLNEKNLDADFMGDLAMMFAWNDDLDIEVHGRYVRDNVIDPNEDPNREY